MSGDKARILVIGAGVNGCLCACALSEAGEDVTLLARGARLEAYRKDGIVIEDPLRKTRKTYRLPLVGRLESEDRYNYILVVLHRHQVAALLPDLARNVSPNVVFMMNNLTGAEGFAPIGRERVMLGFVFGAGQRQGEVLRAVRDIGGPLGAVFGGTPVGESDGSLSPRLERLVALLRGAGLDARPSSAVRDYLATHASVIVAAACAFVRSGGDKLALARSRKDLDLLVEALREICLVLPRSGLKIVPAKFAAIWLIPRWAMRALLRAFLRSRMWDLAAADMAGDWRHSQTLEEVRELARELEDLRSCSGLAAPALRELLAGLEAFEV